MNPLVLDKQVKCSNVFFTSDLHINHAAEFILKKRNAVDAIEAKNQLVEIWNAQTDGDSVVFDLGDFLFHKGQFGTIAEELDWLFDNLEFRTLYMLPGNHYQGYSEIRQRALRQNFGDNLYSVFKNLNVTPIAYSWGNKKIVLLENLADVSINTDKGSIKLVLSHYPLRSWNRSLYNSIMLHGHVHGNVDNSESGKWRTLDVCWDEWNKLLTLSDIMQIMEGRVAKNDYDRRK